MALAAMLNRGIPRWEWGLALVFVAVYNRIFWNIPLPEEGFDAYIDFYAGWSDRVNGATLLRAVEMGFYLAAMVTFRWVAFRAGPRPQGEAP